MASNIIVAKPHKLWTQPLSKLADILECSRMTASRVRGGESVSGECIASALANTALEFNDIFRVADKFAMAKEAANNPANFRVPTGYRLVPIDPNDLDDTPIKVEVPPEPLKEGELPVTWEDATRDDRFRQLRIKISEAVLDDEDDPDMYVDTMCVVSPDAPGMPFSVIYAIEASGALRTFTEAMRTEFYGPSVRAVMRRFNLTEEEVTSRFPGGVFTDKKAQAIINAREA